MQPGQGKHPAIVPMGITVSVLGVAFFLFLHFYSISQSVTYDDDINGASITDIEPDDLSAQSQQEPEQTPAPPRPGPVIPDMTAYRAQLTGDEYTTVQKSQSDIHKGYLLLVNNDIRYDIPDDLDLISVTMARTVPYRVSSSHIRLQSSIMKPFDDMMQAFIDETGRNIVLILSAYRDYASQQSTLSLYIAQEGRETALRRAKQPGHSEHHTGLAVDFATFADGEEKSFTYFDVTKWFPRNCYKYGFILRYASDKVNITNTMYEPWHFRYVGLPHSFIMHDRNWALEEYIEKIKEYTQEEPFTVTHSGTKYEVYYTDNMQITVPVQAICEISGNNTDGFIVTIYNRYDRITNVSVE